MNGAALKGKLIYYVPINYAVPYFHVIEGAIAQAMGHLGATVRACDAQSNPSSAAQCLSTAASQGAAVVVTDSIPDAFAQNAYSQLAAKGIPVIKNSLDSKTAATSTDMSAYVIGDPASNPTSWGTYTADLVATDSNGTGHALYIDFATSPQLHESIAGAKAEMSKVCPHCSITVKPQTTTDQNQAASLVSSALLADPSINYIVATASILQGVTTGLQNANATGKVKFIAITEGTPTVQALKNNAGVYAVVLTAPYYQGWAIADQIVRVVTKTKPVQAYPLPIRILTQQNDANITASDAAFASNQWFGGGNFQSMYLKLWGAS